MPRLLVYAIACCMVASCSTTATHARAVGDWKTWVLTAGKDIMVPPPPKDDTAELTELRALKRKRTPAIIRTIHQWSDGPANKPWVELNLDYVSRETKNPPQASRGYALVSVAIYDAIVAAWHWKYEYNRPPPTGTEPVIDPGTIPSYPSEHAAIAGAASRVLAYLFPNLSPAEHERTAREAAESRVQGGMNYRSDVLAGLALGRAVADKVIAHGLNDGFGEAWDGKHPTGPGYWEPPPGVDAAPVEPLAGTWKTWVADPASVKPPPPPPYGSSTYVSEVREVQQIGDHLTTEQKQIATRWAAGAGTPLPPGLWNEIAFGEIRTHPLDLPHVARAFALLNIAEADAGVAVWAVKYTYWTARPVNVIRELGFDAQWKSFLKTPLFPSYVSGHSAYSAAAAEVLASIFPGDSAALRAQAVEAGQSRIYAGIHFQADNIQGRLLGQKVGRAVVERARGDGSS